MTEPVLVARGGVTAFPRSTRYSCVGVIGQGGMGVIYRAFDRTAGHEVALKVVGVRTPETIGRLKAEFRARADLHHPNLLQHLDLTVTSDEAFFTMELVDAVSLVDSIWEEGEASASRRLVVALLHVLSALATLHAAGFVHFDLKPGNILVDRSGRALLADFGLSAAFASPAVDDGAGTPDFMAPERGVGAPIDPASDLYSVGATIVETLAGHGGDELADGLLTLAQQLMARDPAARPTAAATLDRLSELVALPMRTSLSTVTPPFVGRATQLAALAESFADVSSSKASTIYVTGASGIGKTSLVEHFVRRQQGALLLHGRCHPYEQVAFGGIDRMIDGLAAHLRDHAELANAITPRSLAALVRLFPAIPWRVPLGLHAALDDERELRLLAIAALRQLITAIASAGVVTIWIDDLHWLDPDTEEVLLALAAVPNTFTVYTSWPGARIDGLRSHITHVLELAELDSDDVKKTILAIAPRLDPTRVAELTAAARGIPVLARILAMDAAVAADVPPAVAWNRMIDALPAAQRSLLDSITIAPGPIAAQLATRAAQVSHGSPAVRALEQLGVITRTAERGTIRLTPFHDQLRQMRLGHLDEATRSTLHRNLAASHEQLSSGDFEALVHHLAAIAETDKAARYAVLAGDRAATNLAFAAASSYYARAIDWTPSRSEPWDLHRKLAECEANRGHGEMAGEHFERAATLLDSCRGPTLEARRWTLRASEQLLHCGRIPDGYRILRELLASLNVRLPRSHRGALAQSALLRARLIFRGNAASDVVELDPEQELRIDALWMASTSLAHVNYPLADVMLLHHVRGALDSGVPSRMLKALTYEAAAEVTLGSRYFDNRVVQLLSRAEELVAAADTAYDRGWFEVSCAAIAFFCSGWRQVVTHACAADTLLIQHGAGVAWERAVLHSYWLFALALMGDVDELVRRRELALEDALARRDRLAESHCRSGYTVLARLFRDDVAGARQDRATQLGTVHWNHRERVATNRWPESSFGTPDYHALIADSHIDLYDGQVEAAYERIEAAWPFVEGALLLRIQFVGADLRFLRARCALAARRHSHSRALLKIAMRERTCLVREGTTIATAYAALLDGLIDGSPTAFDAAASAFERLDMRMHAAAARFRRGELRDPAVSRQALACLAAVVDPVRVIEMYAPATA